MRRSKGGFRRCVIRRQQQEKTVYSNSKRNRASVKSSTTNPACTNVVDITTDPKPRAVETFLFSRRIFLPLENQSMTSDILFKNPDQQSHICLIDIFRTLNSLAPKDITNSKQFQLVFKDSMNPIDAAKAGPKHVAPTHSKRKTNHSLRTYPRSFNKHSVT